MSDKRKDRPVFEFHFHGNVGQQIGNVEKMDVHFDKDASIQISNVEDAKLEDAVKCSASQSYPFIILSSKAEEVMEKLRSFMADKSPNQPKDVMKPIRAAQDAGVIRRITYEEMKSAFPECYPKSKSSVSKYTRVDDILHPYTDQAFTDMVETFCRMK